MKLNSALSPELLSPELVSLLPWTTSNTDFLLLWSPLVTALYSLKYRKTWLARWRSLPFSHTPRATDSWRRRGMDSRATGLSLAERVERHRDVLQVAVMWVILFLAYWIAFSISGDGAPGRQLQYAFANSLPPVVIGWIGAVWLWPWLPKSPATRALMLLPMSFVASLLMLLGTRAIMGFETPGGSAATGLSIPLAWQIMQGMAYFFIAFLMGVLCEMDMALAEATKQAGPDSGEKPAAEHKLFVRTDGGIVTVEAGEIVRITAADDYSEIATQTRTLLARMRLSQFEEQLAGANFLRIHRSHIINLDHMLSAEPAGNGKLQTSLRNGDQIVSSRDGAKALRAIAV